MASSEMVDGMVQVNNLSFSFIPGGQETLQGVALSLPAGARCVLIGQNGAGKSTLLEILSGNKMVSAKQVLVCGEDPFRGGSGKKVALVQGGWRGFGDMEKAASMRVWKLLGLAEPSFEADAGAGTPQGAYMNRLREALSLRPLLTRFFGSLSDGERRRVELGLKLQEKKEVVLLDEATTDLDLLARRNLMRFLEAEGTTVINATHVFDGLESWVTHLAHLHGGRVIRFEDVNRFVGGPGTPSWAQFGGLFGLTTRWLGDAVGMEPSAAIAGVPLAKDGSIAVTVKGLKFSYSPCCPSASRLDSLQLPQGCRCVLVGLNGSGKSTLLGILAGRRLIADGDVQVLGFRAFHDHSSLDPLVAILSSEWKRQISEISAGRMVTFAELANTLIQELVASGLDMSMLASRMVRLVQMLGIDPTKPVGSLSDGLLRRVQIALKLLRPSKILLVDEVTADLDVLARLALLNFLKEEACAGCSIVYCTHILDGLDGWASHILRLRPGGHDGELLSIEDVESAMDTTESSSCASSGMLFSKVFGLLTEDSKLEPTVPNASLALAAASSARAEAAGLPAGWNKRGVSDAGGYGDHSWGADRGAEESWSFKSVAPKPADLATFKAKVLAGPEGQQLPGTFPGAASAFPGVAPGAFPDGLMLPSAPSGYMPQPQLNPSMHTSSSSGVPADQDMSTGATTSSVRSEVGLPAGWGSRSNQQSLEELIHRGIAER